MGTDDLLATNITVNTINAGTYLNLPAPNVLPITLDTTNNRVGINKVDPLYSLDVSGNIRTINATVFANSYSFNGHNAKLYARATPPEGALSASPGSICTDSTNGNIYIKNTGTGNTGWLPVATSLPTKVVGSLTSDTTVPGASRINVFTFTLPTAGIYSGTIRLALTSSGSISFYVSSTSLGYIPNWPTIEHIATLNTVRPVITSFMYKCTAPGIHYIVAENPTLMTNLTLLGSDQTCFIMS